MSSFFGKFRGNVPSNNTTINAAVPVKKEHPPPPFTPLQKMLLDAGPLNKDGNDKFFGMENPQYANTCYCNSILQCLYYSVPFRESVLNYPKRSSPEVLEAALSTTIKYPDPDIPLEEALAQAKLKQQQNAANLANRPPGAPQIQPQKPDDKDSPEYKKRVAMHTLPILETTDNSASYGMKESLFTSLKDIFESIAASHERMGVIRPNHFLDVLRREHEMFKTAMHQDAHEFLRLLFNEVVTNVEAEAKRASLERDQGSDTSSDEDTVNSTSAATTLTTTNGNHVPDTNWVHELFEGKLTSETQCLTCEKKSQRDEIFLDLSVDLEQHSSVTACLRKFSEDEMLCERNKFHCDNCGGLQEAEKRMKIKQLPKILALHLKRFKYTEDLQRLQKLFHRVVYPYYLRLFNTTDDAEDPDRLYELYAIVVHIGGGPYHGHYVAIIKTEDRGWLLFDDEMVEPVDKSYVLNFFGDKPGLACAYVLFYQETTFEAMKKEQEKEYMSSKREIPEAKDHMAATPKPNGHAFGPETSRARTAPSTSPAEAVTFPQVVQAPTAPQPLTQPETPTALPDIPPPILSPSKLSHFPLISRKTDNITQSKKERAKEEKDRKAIEKVKEKEKEKEDKQKRKDLLTRRKRQEADAKAALEASKASKRDDDRRSAALGKENGSAIHGIAGGLGRLKIGSKSISYGRNFSRNKENSAQKNSDLSTSLPSQSIIPNGGPTLHDTGNSADDTVSSSDSNGNTNNGASQNRDPQVPSSSGTEDNQLTPNTPRKSDELDLNGKMYKQATTKRSRFSLRKKSFSVL
ncbi:hypothetical protein FQN57_006911 [Myotisia sp. PD_48]|nr:hypothetical protein FQN57_006911 [Myotisia sp. PD_48]